MTTRRCIAIFLLVALLCTGWLVFQSHSRCGTTVEIAQDGTVLYTIDLSQVREPYSLTIPYGDHYNIVEITGQTVWVSEADCDSQVCVAHGPLAKDGSPITCLPHHLTISWSETPFDA